MLRFRMRRLTSTQRLHAQLGCERSTSLASGLGWMLSKPKKRDHQASQPPELGLREVDQTFSFACKLRWAVRVPISLLLVTAGNHLLTHFGREKLSIRSCQVSVQPIFLRPSQGYKIFWAVCKVDFFFHYGIPVEEPAMEVCDLIRGC
jgi:hypothetical protein